MPSVYKQTLNPIARNCENNKQYKQQMEKTNVKTRHST